MAERRIVTAVFVDLVGFTPLAERLDAEDVAAIQDAYFAATRETLERHGGRVEKFIGDAVAAIFGTPRVREDDAERAVRAAVALSGMVERVAAQMELEPGSLRVRVGVNTGEVVYSETDSADRGPVTGDVLNVAARLQAAAPPGGTLLGEATMLAVAHAVDVEEAGALELKGKRAPVRAWRALGVRASPSREQAMGSLRAGMIGRERELATLLDALDRAGPGAAGRVIVIAPPGVGKSRLIRELGARSSPALVLTGRCRAEVEAPYDVVAQLLRGAIGASPGRDRDAAHALPGLAVRAGSTPERAGVIAEEIASLLGLGASPSGLDRDQRADAWLDAFDVLAGGRRAVWLVEDLHWAGADLLAFLARAGERASPAGRLIVGTARPALLDRAPAHVAGASHVLELQPLGPADARALVTGLLGEALPADLVGRVVERSDGNALFIEEVLRAWASAGVLVREEVGWRLSIEPADVAVPSNVRSIYAAELDDLSAAPRTAARCGSVAGRRFPAAALVPLGAAPDGLGALVARGLVSGPHPDPEALVGDVFAFRHALLRDAAYASLARADRARLHVRTAEWLEGVAADRIADVAELIGTHYGSALAEAPALGPGLAEGRTRADVARLAASWLERGAERAWSVAAPASAVALLRRSLGLTADDAGIDRGRRLARLGEILAASGDMAAAARALEEARAAVRDELRRPDGSPEAARTVYARATVRLANVWSQQLHFADAEALADAALREIGERPDVACATLLLARATAAVAHRRWPPAAADVDRALDIARERRDTALELEALLARRDVEGARTGRGVPGTVERSEELARAHGRWDVVISGMRSRAFRHAQRGEGAAAEELYEAASALASARGLVEERLWIEHSRAEAAFASGDWDAALGRAREAIAAAERGALHRLAVRCWFVAGPIAAARGDGVTLRAAFDWHERRRADFPESSYASLMIGALQLHFARGGMGPAGPPAPDRVAAVLDTVAVSPSQSDAVLTVFEAWLSSGDAAAAAAPAALERLARANGSDEAPSIGRGTVALVEAWLRTRRREPGAEASARTALGHFRSALLPWWTARAIAALETLGAATHEERLERTAILRSLGVATVGDHPLTTQG